MLRVQTRDEDGNAICPVCGTEVAEAGQFCTPSCWTHFVRVVSDQGSVVEMEYFIDSALQPWSGMQQSRTVDMPGTQEPAACDPELIADSDDEAA